jgi:hypothetical protein
MCDVFLSYAHQDNVEIAPFRASDDSTLSGWMDIFKHILKNRFYGQAGIREEDADWFIDNQSIRVGQDITEKVQDALGRARAFVVLASRASTNPKSYCGVEWQIIANRIANDPDLNVFGVLIDPDGKREFMKSFPDKKFICFYEKDKDDRPRRLGNNAVNDAFIENVSMLAEDLGQFFAPKKPDVNNISSIDPSKVVFVAWTPPDLEFQRREMIGKIEKTGWKVISHDNRPPSDKVDCLAKLQEYLSLSVVSIHLIGGYEWEVETLQLEEAGRLRKQSLVYSTPAVAASITGSERAKRLEHFRLMARHPTQMFQELFDHLRSLQAKAKTEEIGRQNKHESTPRILASVCVSGNEQPPRIAKVSKPLKDQQIDPIVRRLGEFSFEPAYLSECAAHQNGHVALSGMLDEECLEKILENCQELFLEANKTNGRFPPHAVIYTSKSRKEKIENLYPGHWVSHLLISDQDGIMSFASRVFEFPPAHPSPSD